MGGDGIVFLQDGCPGNRTRATVKAINRAPLAVTTLWASIFQFVEKPKTEEYTNAMHHRAAFSFLQRDLQRDLSSRTRLNGHFRGQRATSLNSTFRELREDVE